MSSNVMARTTTRTPELRRSGGWAAVGVATFSTAWGGNQFTPLLVMYRADGGFSALTADLLLFAYVLGIVPALLVGGSLSDRFGRRPLMLPAPVLAAVGSAILVVGGSSAWALGVGRVFSGLALGLAMAVGGSWIKELSSPPWETAAKGAGARRAAMSLTAGFGLGAAVAGALAEWAPAPTVLPYAVNIAVALVAWVLLLRTPDTRTPQRRNCIPAGAHSIFGCWNAISAGTWRRFVRVLVPVAPWVFGAGASAYAVLPALMADHVAGAPVAFSAVLCLVALGVGFTVQHSARHWGLDDRTGVVVALSLVVLGMVLAAWAAAVLTVWAALIAAAMLGAGYGMTLLVGLQQVERIAGPDDLAALTAVFYSLTYLGFAVPAALAFLSRSLSYPVMFGFGAIAAVVSLFAAVGGSRRPVPIS
ncbi:MFS transporter [Mycolicibacterium sp.]|uniref:MFS transporter n=1 Tax=Mycolicibacterium sp. TaxID=2320850 RepID=UPI003D13FEB0